ncbi:MAG TPA: flagellar export protein FliJ [Nitrospirota bacterium]|jgi:flagellar export protein FliJ
MRTGLDTVKRFRKEQLDEKVQELHEASMQLDSEEKTLDDIKAARAACGESMRGGSKGTLDMDSIMMRYQYGQFLDGEAEEQVVKIDRARGFVDIKKAEVLEASIESKIMDKAVEKRLAKLSKEEARRERKFLDDISATQYRKRQRETA